jgi:fumarylacetoacetase
MPVLNDYLELGKRSWAGVRSALSHLLASPAPPEELTPGDFVVRMDEVDLLLPIAVGDYVDFYSSVEHATNVGKLFRPGEPSLPPNWRHLPIGYHGRASSAVLPSTDPGANGARPVATLHSDRALGSISSWRSAL